MSDSVEVSTTAIRKAVVEKLNGDLEVICARGQFSYVVNSKTFCQESAHDVTCYVFRQL